MLYKIVPLPHQLSQQHVHALGASHLSGTVTSFELNEVAGERFSMKQNLTLRIIVSASALLIAAAHIWRPKASIDSITIVLLVICAIPWLQPLIKTVELLGVKLELQDLQDKVAEAKGAAESASRQAGLALSATNAQPASAQQLASSTMESSVKVLADAYETIRRTQPSGDARTSAMTDVMRRMITLAKSMESFPVTDSLRDDSSGMRLFAYAYLYARPDSRFLPELVASVTGKEHTPFGQYWGLQSIGHVMSTMEHVPEEIKSKLRGFALRLPHGTDREYELKKLLKRPADI